jgi:hypothetical protein
LLVIDWVACNGSSGSGADNTRHVRERVERGLDRVARRLLEQELDLDAEGSRICGSGMGPTSSVRMTANLSGSEVREATHSRSAAPASKRRSALVDAAPSVPAIECPRHRRNPEALGAREGLDQTTPLASNVLRPSGPW